MTLSEKISAWKVTCFSIRNSRQLLLSDFAKVGANVIPFLWASSLFADELAEINPFYSDGSGIPVPYEFAGISVIVIAVFLLLHKNSIAVNNRPIRPEADSRLIGTGGYDVIGNTHSNGNPVHMDGLYRSLAENLQDGLIALCENRITYINNAGKQIFAKHGCDMIGTNILDFIHPSDHLPFHDAMNELVENRIPGIEKELQLLTDEKDLPVFVSIHASAIHTGHCKHNIIGTVKDITLYKLLNKEIQEREQRYRDLIEMSPEAILVHRDNRILFCNNALRTLAEIDESYQIQNIDMSHFFPGILPLPASDFEKSYTHPLEMRTFKGKVKSLDALCATIDYNGSPSSLLLLRKESDMPDTNSGFKELCKNNDLILQAAGEGIYGVDRHGKITFANPTTLKYFGHKKEDIIGKDQHELGIHLHDKTSSSGKDECPVIKTIQDGTIRNVNEDYFITEVGTRFPVEYTVTPILVYGESQGAVVIFRDITERIIAEKELRLTKALFENTAEAMMITDASQKIIAINPAFSRVTGYPESEILGKKPGVLKSKRHSANFYKTMWEEIHTKGHWRGEIWNRRKSGEIYVQRLTLSAIKDPMGKTINYISVFSDITKEKEEELETKYRANHDALTGLSNRSNLKERMENAIHHAKRKRQKLGILYIDLDFFKLVNDNFGHIAGDRVLISVASILQKCTRQSDTVARVGGDEFVLVLDLEDHDPVSTTLPVLNRILENMGHSQDCENICIKIGCSIGVSIYPDNSENIDELIDFADRAMYIAKKKGGNTYTFFDRK